MTSLSLLETVSLSPQMMPGASPGYCSSQHISLVLSEDLARRRANFSIVTSSLKSFYEDEQEFTNVSNYSGSLYWLISVSVISSCWYS